MIDGGHAAVSDRILVVLPNWVGETLFATPFLRAVRTQRPGSRLATLGWLQCREVLLHNPCVDECLDYDERGAHRSLAGKRRLIRILRAHRFDAAFILRKSLSRSALLALAGIPIRIGFANPKSGWLLTHRIHAGQTLQHKAASYLPLLGASAALSPYEYVVSEEEWRAAHAWLRGFGIEDDRPFIVLHPGANWFHKRWPPERFAEVGDRLRAAHHMEVLITGGPDGVPLAASIAARMREPSMVAAGRTSLRGLAACLAQARLVVSNDTGVLHVAAALRRPVVALYGPTSPALTGPLGDPERTIILHHPDCCPAIPCYQPDHPGHPGMGAITVDEAYTACAQLLEPGVR